MCAAWVNGKKYRFQDSSNSKNKPIPKCVFIAHNNKYIRVRSCSSAEPAFLGLGLHLLFRKKARRRKKTWASTLSPDSWRTRERCRTLSGETRCRLHPLLRAEVWAAWGTPASSLRREQLFKRQKKRRNCVTDVRLVSFPIGGALSALKSCDQAARAPGGEGRLYFSFFKSHCTGTETR